MTKSELEKKPLSDLHSLAAEAGVERFRMLTKAELVEKLADGEGGGSGEGSGGSGRAPRSGRSRSGSGSGRGRSTSGAGRTGTDAGEDRSERSGAGRSGGSGEGRSGGSGRSSEGRSGEGRSSASGEDGERPRRRRRRSGSGSGSGGSGGREREAAHEETEEEGTERAPEATPERAPEPAPAARAAAADSGDEGSARPKRRRRRRRFGRRKDGISIQDLLLPPESGRQAVLVGESRAACTALLRGIAADLAGDSKGPDPVALLIDPTPEELADWKREAPQAEIVSAGQARHATDALALAKTRAAGEDVILLVDSLTRLAEEFGDTDTAKDFFDAGQNLSGSGSLTVVAALERGTSD